MGANKLKNLLTNGTNAEEEGSMSTVTLGGLPLAGLLDQLVAAALFLHRADGASGLIARVNALLAFLSKLALQQCGSVPKINFQHPA